MEAAIQRRAPRELGYRGQQVLNYVRLVIAQEGSAPSYEMIREALDLYDRAAVVRVVQCLERRGLIRRAGAGRVRRIKLVA